MTIHSTKYKITHESFSIIKRCYKGEFPGFLISCVVAELSLLSLPHQTFSVVAKTRLREEAPLRHAHDMAL